MVWHVQLPELAYDVLELDLEHLEPNDYLTPVQAKVPEVRSFYRVSRRATSLKNR